MVAAIGGDNRYYSLNTLWNIRETLDWLIGGRGLARGRRHPTEIRVGDRIDSWKVIGLEPERRLAMVFGLRAPGTGVLEFLLEPLPGNRTRLTATAYWHPDGVPGLLYWLAMEPFHQVIFAGLTREVCRRADRVPGSAASQCGEIAQADPASRPVQSPGRTGVGRSQ